MNKLTITGQLPSIGRIVHYYDGYRKFAALVVEIGVETYDATLRIFHPGGFSLDQTLEFVPYSDEYQKGHWSWPPRVI